MSSNKKYWKGVEELHQTSGFEENNNSEFPAEIPIDEFLGDSKLGETAHSRRDFLKFLGFSVAAATLAACEAPVTKSVPYVNKPEDITPGIANWYASAYYDGNAFANILVKAREGRPIFIKGNPHHGITRSSVNPRIIASVLSLYDEARLKMPLAEGEDATWEYVDKYIKEELEKIAAKGGKIRLVTNSVISPTALMAIEDFKKRYTKGGDNAYMRAAAEPSENATQAEPVVAAVGDTLTAEENIQSGAQANQIPQPGAGYADAEKQEVTSVGNAQFEHIMYDAISYSAIRIANQKSFGVNGNHGNGVIPSYDFSKAKTIVSIGADFLATWLLSTEYAPQYGMHRDPEDVKHNGGWMSRHFQFESNMSITGANADYRTPVKPSEFGAIAAGILEGLGGESAGVDYSTYKTQIDKVVAELKKTQGESLVVSGSNDVGVQMLVNAINSQLGAYGNTISLDDELYCFNGNDEKMNALVEGVIADPASVDAVIFVDCNPVYTLPNGAVFAEALKEVSLTISTSMHNDETASRCKYVCPTHHYLEAWNDYNPKAGYYALAQPVIRPVFDSRSWAESLWVWAGATKNQGRNSTFYHDQVKDIWYKYGYTDLKNVYKDQEDFWNNSVHNGGSPASPMKGKAYTVKGGSVKEATGLMASAEEGNYEVFLYQKNSIGEGQMAGNPWLQEMPDPITTVTWDNYITMSHADMRKEGYEIQIGQKSPASVAKVKVGETELQLPVIAQPGQAPGTIGIAVGYGRGNLLGVKDYERYAIGKGAYATGEYGDPLRDDENVIMPIGANAYMLSAFNGKTFTNHFSAHVSGTDEIYPIAATQTHHTVMGRHSIIKETSLDFYTQGWKETNYANAHNREGFNPRHSMPVHKDVAGGVGEDGRLVFDVHGNGKPDDHLDANDREHISSFDLWNDHPVEKVGHRWGMTIDLTSCIGCGSCVVACQAENNVPVVGKDEVRRVRIMHWMRIDRYYKSEVEDFIGTRQEEHKKDYDAMEHPEANPSVVFQPMLCQHCNHAPCETVCPVVATTHSNEGLNQMTYNRCIGTRYCANNCPYKVRRFNWFNYPSYKKFTAVNPAQDDLGRMVLNPDVVVRTRGVMEKCSLCVQRIQEGKLGAKKETRPVKDGDIETACQSSCPTNAIIFGDLNDKEEAYRNEASKDLVNKDGSKVYKSAISDRSYHVLEEIGTRPNLFYKIKVRNIEDPLMTEEERETGEFIYHPPIKSEGGH